MLILFFLVLAIYILFKVYVYIEPPVVVDVLSVDLEVPEAEAPHVVPEPPNLRPAERLESREHDLLLLVVPVIAEIAVVRELVTPVLLAQHRY